MGGSLALMSEVLQLNKPGFEADLKRKKPYFPVTNGHILTKLPWRTHPFVKSAMLVGDTR